MATPNTPATPFTPSTIASSDLPWRKKVPFNLIGRGVAGIDEMQEYLEDTKVYFGIVTFEIGSGSFKRNKSIFIHFNGEKHPKPLQRAKANKKIKAARKLFSPYNVELVLENTKQCTIDYFFSRLKNIFVSDNAVKGSSKFDIGSLKDEYKKKMKEARKKAKAEKERLELQRQKLLAQEEEEKRIVEQAKHKAEEEERLKREAEEARIRAEEERIRAEEEEKRRIEEEARKQREAEEEAERLRLEKEKKEKEEAELEAKKKAEEELKLKKPKKRKKKKRRTKDDWSDDREWTGKRIVKCIHAQTSPMNWAVFKPSDTQIIPMAFGHGDLNDLRDALKGDQVQYGIMRLTFGEGRFRRSHWVFVCWSPDTMTKVDSQKLRKKRMQHRMKHIGNKGWMQKAIGPYGVEVLAEDHDQVTLEDWILRVRKTVVVDGNDELMNADAFRKALEAEKEHFAEMQKKKEEQKRKKEELEKKLNDNETSSEEELYDKELAKKNKKKRKRKKDGNDNDSGDDENDENDNDNDENEDKNIEEEKGDNDDDDDDKKQEDKKQEDKTEENKEDISVDDVNEKARTSLLTVDASVVKEKRKSSLDPSVIKARDVSSQLCYESITLIKRPDSDLVWVLIEPRLKGRR